MYNATFFADHYRLIGNTMKYKIHPIGIIHSPYKTKEECPVQGKTQLKGKGLVLVDEEYEEGLKDIETFSHIILLYLFDRAGEILLTRKPFLDDQPHGIFAIRHPSRPNGIGLSIVELMNRKGRILEVLGIDVLDNTPLVDIKPYVPRFDYFPDANNGWVGSVEFRPKPSGRE